MAVPVDDWGLWVETYRPKTINECILPQVIKSSFLEFLNQGNVPNLILSGTAGTGKTTAARAICEELGVDYMMINGSDEGRLIDTLRNKIIPFCTTVSMTGGRKVLIIDEADYMNAESVQPAMRGCIEKFASNCSFIFTCNFKNRIIEPIKSRCSGIEFKIDKDDRPDIAGQFMKRMQYILDVERIGYDVKVLAEMITKHFPDFRRCINELQRYSVSGKIDIGILSNLGEINLNQLVDAMKDKKFSEVRKWVVDNMDNDPVKIYRKIYDKMYEFAEPTSVPQIVLILADYSYKSAFVADQEINLVACLTELMVDCKFKE
jgi:DNA polymerase III delta prime subunit